MAQLSFKRVPHLHFISAGSAENGAPLDNSLACNCFVSYQKKEKKSRIWKLSISITYLVFELQISPRSELWADNKSRSSTFLANTEDSKRKKVLTNEIF